MCGPCYCIISASQQGQALIRSARAARGPGGGVSCRHGLTVTAAVASLVTLAAAALARLSVPKTTVP